MLYLLFNERKQAPWQERYERTYIELLDKHDIAYEIADYGTTQNLEATDYLWVMHFKDLDWLYRCPTKAKVIYRMSGTSVHPYCYQVDKASEYIHLTNVIDINLSFHPRMTEVVLQRFPHITMVDTGYPIDVRPLPPASVREKMIIVGGRLTPDKQFMLTAFLLQPYLEQGYRVVFCYPDNGGKDTETMRQVHGDFFRWTALGFEFERCDHPTWMKRCAQAEFYFTASLGDTACCSCIEAVVSGAYPLVPKIAKGLPVYDTYIDVGYEPFSQSSLDHLIKTKPPVTVDHTWFDPDLFATRFKEILV